MRTQRDARLDDLEHEVATLMRRGRRVVQFRATHVHPDLSSTGYLILRLLKDQGAIRASVIVELFETDKGAISRQVQHAIDLGLIERSSDPADKRASLLQLTQAGVAGLSHVDEVRRQRLKERLGEWDDASLSDLVTTLNRYNRVFEDFDQCF